MSSLELLSVGKTYGTGAPVLRDVSLSVAQGEFCVFVGPSGCGKSTLLRMVAGLEDMSTGTLHIDGQRMNETPPARRGVAMVFQSYALFPHMSVYDNMAFGMQLAGLPPARVRQKVLEVARALQLESLLERKPRALSGGQRQRVAIGRAIVREPGVFLFDEPLSNLDAALRVQTRHEIARIHRHYGRASTVYVTHDQVEAMTLADHILLLNAPGTVQREGSVAQWGTPLALYHHPRNLFVAGFMGSPRMNFLPGVFERCEEACAHVRLHTGERLRAFVDARRLQCGEPVTVGIRPEHVLPGQHAQHLLRTVQWQERLGEATCLYLDSGEGQPPLVVRLPGRATGQPGQRVALTLPEHSLHVFDAQGLALPRSAVLHDQPLAAV